MTRFPRRAYPALFILCATTAACAHRAADEVETEAVVAVKTARAAVGTIRGVVQASGVVAPAPGAELVVVAPEAARIADIPNAVGDRVRKGDVLVRFEIPRVTADVEREQAETGRDEAGLETARAAQTRARELFERGVAARRDVEDANRAVADAEAMLAQARASLAAARAVAARSTVRASFDGIVTRRQHNPGDLVEPSAGDPVLHVVDVRRLEIVASIGLSDAARVVDGASGRLTSPSRAGTIALRVISTPAAVEAGSATLPVRLGFGAPATLPVGTPVQVEIDAELHTGVVLVPKEAIVREGEVTVVFVANGQKAERRVAPTGLTDGTNVEILSGVAAGDQVIVDGQAGLPDGAAIAPSTSAGTPPDREAGTGSK